ncbi:MAG: rRNA maturation RNase YbeY [Hyphomicrobium sp.]
MPERRRESAVDLAVDLSESGGDWSLLGDDAACIFAAAAAVAQSPGVLARPSQVAISLGSDDEVATLNAAYRGKTTPTNVLSFPAGRGGPTGFLGDIVLAAETVRREAEEQGVPFTDYVQHLIVHGLLHLLGYDHESETAAERMEALETSILASLGVADPYNGELIHIAAKE